MDQNNVIIQIEHLSKSFENHLVLDDINLSIKQGEFVTLLGPSGCGKTTLLRLLAGFIAPDEGNIMMEGKDLTGIPPYKRQLNTVFQRYALFPHLDVYDNIAFGLKINKMTEEEIDRRVSRVLKMVSMTDYEDRDVNSLSGGQQQRVAIARAIVNRPKVLLLDEPLAALDLKMRKDMQIELKEMHRKLGITFIYVTHDQEEALTLSDTIVVMNNGVIQQIGTPTDIYNEPCNSFVADFIGDSNILNGRMITDCRVECIGHQFNCVDEGFGENVPVDVVIRPEDIYIMNKTEGAQFTGVVKSCTFKGVHYEMFVDTDSHNELMVQDYNAFEVGSTVGLFIKPSDFQVMKKERTCNTFEGVMTNGNTVEFCHGEFNCADTGWEAGTRVRVEIDFDKIDLRDNRDEGTLVGEVSFILYKGNHYHLTITTDDHDNFYVDTNDIWDKWDMVGIRIQPEDIRLTKLSTDNE
ncbi:MAG: polyamine ABC transporter ATP-binding protein [Bacteroidales bacterium]|nr:polyamine ABC transporter ATP-binding protein [Bacteroidales bacterium]